MSDVAQVVYDPFDPSFHEDPHPVFAELREHDPLHRTPLGIHLVTRYEDVWRLLRDHRLGRDIPIELVRMAQGDGPGAERFFGNMLNREGADHTRLRRLMSMPFTPRRVGQLRERTAALVDELLEPVEDRLDLAVDVAAVLPVFVICDLLGLPREDREVVRPWATAMAEASTIFPPPEVVAANEAALLAFSAYFEDVLAGHRYDDDGLFAALVAAESDGDRLGHDDLVINATLLFFAGFETTTNLLGNLVLALLRHPGELAKLRLDETLVPNAVDEGLRYDGPLLTAPRITHEPIETSVGTIKAGRVIELGLAAANRDPRAFPDPDRFDVTRDPNDHVAFGSGAHFCLGASLARMEAQEVLTGLLRTFVTFEQAGPEVRRSAAGIRGLASLPLAVRRGERPSEPSG